MSEDKRINKPGGVMHTDLTRAMARISHAMMLTEDQQELRELSGAYSTIERLVDKLFGSKRPGPSTNRPQNPGEPSKSA